MSDIAPMGRIVGGVAAVSAGLLMEAIGAAEDATVIGAPLGIATQVVGVAAIGFGVHELICGFDAIVRDSRATSHSARQASPDAPRVAFGTRALAAR